jgi:hypothetical protein
MRTFRNPTLAKCELKDELCHFRFSQSKFKKWNPRQVMKQLLAGLGALALLSLFSPLYAQTSPPALTPSGPSSYDISKEVTLKGTVANVVANHSPGFFAGSHLLLTTLSGPVDISLGAFALLGNDPLPVTPGQQVEVVGVMKALKDKQFFLARAVKVGDRVYEIRNVHGIPISPLARERASQKAAQNGEAR